VAGCRGLWHPHAGDRQGAAAIGPLRHPARLAGLQYPGARAKPLLLHLPLGQKLLLAVPTVQPVWQLLSDNWDLGLSMAIFTTSTCNGLEIGAVQEAKIELPHLQHAGVNKSSTPQHPPLQLLSGYQLFLWFRPLISSLGQ